MGKREFDEFLAKQSPVREEEIDWDEQRDEWLGYLDRFYTQVEGFVAEYVKSGRVAYRYETVAISEELIGEYCVRVLRLDISGRKVRIEPVGTNLIGAKGRVDLEGAGGRVRIVLVDASMTGPSMQFPIRIEGEPCGAVEQEWEPDEIQWVWKIATPPPRIRYLELNQETFLNALMEVVGG